MKPHLDSTPYRPLTVETPEQREIRELNDYATRLKMACADWAQSAMAERDRAQFYARRANTRLTMFVALLAFLVLSVTSPLLAAWWASW